MGLLACRSGAAGPQPTPAPEGATTEPSAATPPESATPEAKADTRPRIQRADACAPGAVVIAEAGLCLRLPEGFTPSAPTPGAQVFEAPDAPPITVRWATATSSFAKAHVDAIAHLSAFDTHAIEGSTRDGSGSFVYAVEVQPQAHRVVHSASTLRAGGRVAWCTASAPAHAELSREFFEACQSLMTAD